MKNDQDAVLSVPRTEGMQFLSATILPWRGMTVYQLRAWIPALGEVDLLEPPRLDAQNPSAAGGLLIPFANRLRGTAIEEGAAIEVAILGRRVRIPTNWGNPDAERLAIHGFIFASPFESVTTESDNVRAELNAGNFEGRWLSSTKISTHMALRQRTFALTVTATNVGEDPLPTGIGWHPNFRYPSGRREQVILGIPSGKRTLVNSYQDCFPTGELVPIAGTDYDFSQSEGSPLGTRFLDDCFTSLRRDKQGAATSVLTDPAARFRLLVKSISPEISAVQVYAPKDRPFVAIEPQFNLADPFSSVWRNQHTGMVVLAPGQSVNYQVELELQELP